jgi:hypothetical protein
MDNRVVAEIASHLADWQVAHVELAIYGTDDASRIARVIDEFCCHELRSAADQTLFYQSSIGAVAGLRLRDGRSVVVKAHQPNWTFKRLEEVAHLQSKVATDLELAPQVLAGPAPLGNGFAIVEQYIDRGSIRNGHESAIRRALAISLHAVVEYLTPFTLGSVLPPSLLTSPCPDKLWPQPHSKLFDFDTTHEGAEYIEELAAAARTRMVPAGREVIGHSDWRSEHVRFDGDRLVLGFDWDSLCRVREPALVGTTAHAFCADWSRADIAQSPTLDEARAFVCEYEAAACKKFSQDERALCGAAFAYSVAYTARCGHSGGVDARDHEGTFQHLIATEGLRLLQL